VDFIGTIYRGYNIPRIPLNTLTKIDSINQFNRSDFKNIIVSQFGQIFNREFFEQYLVILSLHSLPDGTVSLSMPLVKNEGKIYLFTDTSTNFGVSMVIENLVILLLPRKDINGDFELIDVTRSIWSNEDRSAGFDGLYTNARISVSSPLWKSDVEPEIIHKVKSTSSILNDDIWSTPARDLLSSYSDEFFENNFLLMIQLVSEENQLIRAGWVLDDGIIRFQKREVRHENRVHNFFFEFDKKFAHVEFYVDFRER
jgi:hypothetical protein